MSILSNAVSTLRKITMATIAPVYSFCVAALILMLTSSPYEFMIGEMDGDHKMTYCDLPPPSDGDDPTAEYATFTGMLVLVLLVVGAARSYRARRIRPSLVCGVLLLLMWAYLFFLRRIGC
jgi:hypothetical protein